MLDPLDTGKPAHKRWEEFRAQYAGATLLNWVFKDLRTTASEAVADLSGRLDSSIDSYPRLLREEAQARNEEWDGEVPFHGPDGGVEFWASVETIEAIRDSLFPHSTHDRSLDTAIAAAIIVALHSALDAYAKGLGIRSGQSLPVDIRDWLESRGSPLSIGHFEELLDCDATRHIIVHNRGIVDDKYIRQVRNSPYLHGEFRPLTFAVVDQFDAVVLAAGALLHIADS